MNTDIHFKISAPATLSIFGEHTKNRLRTSIDLRTTLYQPRFQTLLKYISFKSNYCIQFHYKNF